MLRIFSVLFIIFLNTHVCFAGEWYQDGTLHKETLGDWSAATYSNRLATSPDMAYVFLKDSKPNINPRRLRPYAEQLMECVNEVAVGTEFDYLKVAEIAGTCMILSGWTD
jgi:hypothetical protein